MKPNDNYQVLHRQRGVTLVEMMIAFALSAILILGVTQIFSSNKLAFNMQGGVARIQESGRIVSELMSRDIRNAGFMGCGSGTSFNSIVKASAYSNGAVQEALAIFSGNESIVAFNNVTTIASGSRLANLGLSVGTATGQIVAGTDVLILQSATPCDGGKVTGKNTAQANANIKIVDAVTCGLQQHDIVIVSNCKSADMFSIINNPQNGNPNNQDTLAHGNGLYNTANRLVGDYDDDSYVYKPESNIFYVARSASGEPALYMRRLNYAQASTSYVAHELATGVENLQILLGEDTNGDDAVNRFVVPETAGMNMNEVLAIRINALIRSETGATTMPQTYTFNGTASTVDDGRLRTPYQTTVAIRSRVK